jgi:transcriptional regulator with XRE-family HTH domain
MVEISSTVYVDTPRRVSRQQEMLKVTPAQSRAARALLDWSQPDLAGAAGLGLSTVVDFERSRRAVPEKTIAAIRAALEAAGVEFIDQNGAGPGVRLRDRIE